MNTAGIFLVNTIFNLYLILLGIRFILCYVRGDYFNPFSQIVTRFTHPIIIPLRHIIPSFYRFESATLVLMLILELLKFLLISLLSFGIPDVASLFILASVDTLKLFLNIFFYTILLQAILSWVQPGFTPLSSILYQLSAPIIRPLQRIIPPVSGFDLSPIPAMILLQLGLLLLQNFV